MRLVNEVGEGRVLHTNVVVDPSWHFSVDRCGKLEHEVVADRIVNNVVDLMVVQSPKSAERLWDGMVKTKSVKLQVEEDQFVESSHVKTRVDQVWDILALLGAIEPV
jgi:hypothetical protein